MGGQSGDTGKTSRESLPPDSPANNTPLDKPRATFSGRAAMIRWVRGKE